MPKTEKPKGSKELQKSNNGQNLTKEDPPFKPTRKMIRWLETTLELGHTASITDISKESKIKRQSWYLWLQDDGFVKWWDDQMQKVLHQNRWKLDAIGLKQAKTKYNFWKDMMNRVGNTIPEPMSIGTQVNTQFNIPDANLERITKK